MAREDGVVVKSSMNPLVGAERRGQVTVEGKAARGRRREEEEKE